MSLSYLSIFNGLKPLSVGAEEMGPGAEEVKSKLHTELVHQIIKTSVKELEKKHLLWRGDGVFFWLCVEWRKKSPMRIPNDKPA